MPKRVLILCTGNSCRSQMAEDLWRKLGEGAWESFSAGSKPAGYVHPMAVEVMQEIGVDLSKNRSKRVDVFAGKPFDVVVTVCDGAKESPALFFLAPSKRCTGRSTTRYMRLAPTRRCET